MSTERLSGTVKWYNGKKGFGFIAPDAGNEDVFVHYSEIPRPLRNRLDTGDRVSFDVGEGTKGPAAQNVTKL